MGLFKASEIKSQRSWQLIRAAFSSVVENPNEYMIAYAYWMKGNMTAGDMYNFVAGFKIGEKGLILLPIDSQGNVSGKVIKLNQDNVLLMKKTIKGSFQIRTSLFPEIIEITVPGLVPDSMEKVYQLPINQPDEALAFIEMMKNFK